MAVVDEQSTAPLLDARYRLIERVGTGGSAEVHRAEDVVLGRIVAVKMLRAEHENPLGGERVHRETALLASLNHPSIVTLYDAQLDPGRPQYLVMEFVEGRTLAQVLDRGPLGAGQVAALGLDLATALSLLHERGVVHRDVKPSNVLLGSPLRPGQDWTVKLADFGIAHVIDDPRMTTPGTAVGTAAYMAPEQVRTGEADPAADVYSLGLVLLEALTGKPAFPRTGGVQTALARLSAPPEIPVSVGPEWSLLLTRMTRTDPRERPTASDVAAAAGSLVSDIALTAEHAAPTAVMAAVGDFSATTGETKVLPAADVPVGPPSRRRRTGLIVLLCASLLSILGVAGAWAVGASGDSPARMHSDISFVKTPAPPVEEAPPADDESPQDGNENGKGNEDGNENGQKGKDEGESENSGKKDGDD